MGFPKTDNTTNQRKKKAYAHPSDAGAHNIPASMLETAPKQDEDERGHFYGIAEVFHIGQANKKRYPVWDEHDLAEQFGLFLTFINEKGLKPSRPLLRTWLGIATATEYDWLSNPTRNPSVSELYSTMLQTIETTYVQRSEKYPTANLALLKMQHGYKEVVTTVNIVNTVSADNVMDAIAKLGLDE